jgi:dTDP-4-amino-4,6-dideoxygalactose transaminase
MRRKNRGALPPAGAPIGWRELRAVLRSRDPEALVASGLAAALGTEQIRLYASGREALRCVLLLAAARAGRGEVVVPAYTCFSVPSAAVAAGLRVRLVDVTERGQIDPDAFAHLPLERAAAVVVCNLFGVPEPVSRIREIAEAAGVLVVDDAAQALGSVSEEGPVGARGHFGLLSFGRGKPLFALGGGAAVWLGPQPGPADPGRPGPARVKALIRAAAYDLALHAVVFRGLAAIPALRIGETSFDPGFRRGPIDGASLALTAALLPRVEAEGRARAARALRLAQSVSSESRFEPLLAEPASVGVYPRLALRAPSGQAREAACRKLETLGMGASRMYPSGLEAVEALRPALVDPQPCRGARDLAARILTLPTHGRLRGVLLEQTLAVLAAAAGAPGERAPS